MFSCFKDKDFLNRFIRISLPVMISSLVTFLVGFLDNIMVGTVSNEVVSGVYAANQVTFLFQLAAFGVLEGAGIFIQQFKGANDNDGIKQCFRLKIVMSAIFMVIVIPLIYLFGHHIIYFFCQKDTNSSLILKEGKSYLYLIAISYIPFMIGDIYSSSLREIGETKYAMKASFVAVGINFVFNLVFIIALSMGAKGAALATILARLCEMIYLIFRSHKSKFVFSDKIFSEFKISLNMTKKVISKGWLLFINEIGYSVGVVLQSLAFSQRDGVLSSISIVTTISNIFSIVITGLSTGIGVMVGSSLGASDFDKAKDDNKKLNYLGFYMSIIIGITLIALSPVIPMLFKAVDQSQKDLATKLIIIYGILLWGNCLSVTSYFTLKVGGKSKLTFFLDSGTMLLVYIPLSWYLAYFTKIDMLYIYLIIRSIDVLKALFGIYLMKRGTWLNNLTQIEEEFDF